MMGNFTQQEVLLLTNTSFGHRQWCKKESENNFALQENIEEACANGLIQEMLPEVFVFTDHKMFLWEMHPGFSFLQLELGEFPMEVDKRFSVDPHNFLSTLIHN
jgi:hypothetical protein